MAIVSASELQKNFGKYQAQARREAVQVTSHGHASVVLLAVEDYERLKALDDRMSLHPSDLPPDALKVLDDELEKLENVEATPLPSTLHP